jgi:hypothetical protein
LRFSGPIRRNGRGARVAQHAAAARGAWVNLLICGSPDRTCTCFAAPSPPSIMLDAGVGLREAQIAARCARARRRGRGRGLVMLLTIAWDRRHAELFAAARIRWAGRSRDL